jgi:hemolysin III
MPDYTRGEEITNMVTHIVGGGVGIVVLVLAVVFAAIHRDPWAVTGGAIYGVSMICLYAVSSVYHGLLPCRGKRVMRVIDHCTIYLLIAGTYTPILLSAIRPLHPALAWTVFGCEWGAAALAAAFTAIDLKKYSKLSMACYIVMGWFIVIVLKPTIEAISFEGFLWLLGGGVAYTVGAVLYGLGKKRRYFHSVFHVFVDIGSILQAICILRYVI